jgi:Spy/CpxP family protein refolding chaperone
MHLRTISALGLAGSLAWAGCATSSAEAPPASAASTPSDTSAPAGSGDDAAAASVGEFHQVHHRGGFASFIALSLDTLGPDDTRRPQVEKIQSDLTARLAPVRDAEKTFIQALADGVAAGNVDPAKVDAAIAPLAAASAGALDAITDALNQLHALLSPEERSALVDKVQSHWAVWREVNSDAAPGGREPGGRLARLTEDLALSPDQVDKISAAARAANGGSTPTFDPKEMEGHLQTFAKAFASDSFDAKSIIAARDANGRVVGQGATRMARFIEAATPILTPDQRAKLAGNLRDHLNH